MKRSILLALSLLLLVSCSVRSQHNTEKCTLYYFNSEDNIRLVPVPQDIKTASPEEMIAEAFSLLSATDNKNALPVITNAIKLSDVSFSDGNCFLTLSGRYGNLPSLSKAAVDACLVKTLCSLSFINKVTISCEGASVEYSDADFVTDAPRTVYDTYTVNLYFANETFDGLQSDREIISLAPDTTLEYAVVSRLLKGPSSETLKSAIPPATKLNDVIVSEGICIINLSQEFVTDVIHDEISEGIAVYSIVNTVTELPMINSVKFLIDGNEGYGYSFFDLSKPLTNAAELFNK